MPAKPRRRTPSSRIFQFLFPGASYFDELIVAAQAKGLGGTLVHGRRCRMRDRRAKQTGKNAAGGKWMVGGGFQNRYLWRKLG